jgi:hypothetical protein
VLINERFVHHQRVEFESDILELAIELLFDSEGGPAAFQLNGAIFLRPSEFVLERALYGPTHGGVRLLVVHDQERDNEKTARLLLGEVETQIARFVEVMNTREV